MEDIDLETNPVRIGIRDETTKSGEPRTTFMSIEAKEALEALLKIRIGYGRTALKRSHINPKKRRVSFPLSFQLHIRYRTKLFTNCRKV